MIIHLDEFIIRIIESFVSKKSNIVILKGKTPLTSLGFEIYGYSISNFGLGTSRKIYDSATGVVPTETSFFV